MMRISFCLQSCCFHLEVYNCDFSDVHEDKKSNNSGQKIKKKQQIKTGAECDKYCPLMYELWGHNTCNPVCIVTMLAKDNEKKENFSKSLNIKNVRP